LLFIDVYTHTRLYLVSALFHSLEFFLGYEKEKYYAPFQAKAERRDRNPIL
jgi:hypothetical protein